MIYCSALLRPKLNTKVIFNHYHQPPQTFLRVLGKVVKNLVQWYPWYLGRFKDCRKTRKIFTLRLKNMIQNQELYLMIESLLLACFTHISFALNGHLDQFLPKYLLSQNWVLGRITRFYNPVPS